MKVSRGFETFRNNSTTKEVIWDFYVRLDDQIKAKSVGMIRIYNFNKTGLSEGEIRLGKVVDSSLKRLATPLSIFPGLRLWNVSTLPAAGSSPT